MIYTVLCTKLRKTFFIVNRPVSGEPGAGGKFVFAEEFGFGSGCSNDEAIVFEIDAALVPLQHVQSQQHIHRLVLQNRERRLQEVVADLNLTQVNAP